MIRGNIFTKSRLGKKILLVFLFLVAVPLAGIALLSQELSGFVLARATEQLLKEATKFSGLNLLDRARSAETLLKVLNSSQGNLAPESDAMVRARTVFSEITYYPVKNVGQWRQSTISISQDPLNGQTSVAIEVTDVKSRRTAIGVLSPSYLWENLESPYYTLCVGGKMFIIPICQGAEPSQGSAIKNERALYFRPYLEGEPWKVSATAVPNITDYLPIKLSTIYFYLAAAALFLALSASAFFIRRAMTPLDALIQATNAIREGRYSHMVRTDTMKDEFREVAESFNGMTATIGADIAFMHVLSTIDEAILERRPLEDVVMLGMHHLSLHAEAQGLQLIIVHSHLSGVAYRVEKTGQVSRKLLNEALVTEARQVLDEAILVGKSTSLDAYIHPPANAVTLNGEIASFRKRLAVAIDSEEHERILVTRAAHDSLTHLLNRLGLTEKLDELLRETVAARQMLAVVYLDLDGFKEVNDAYGHDAGDRLLVKVAERMRSSLDDRQLALARMGGDEFVFVLPVRPSIDHRSIIAKVLQDLQQPFQIDRIQIQVGASFGVAAYPDDGENRIELLKSADLAMYAAKSRGRNKIVYFDPSLHSVSAERIKLRRELGEALERQEFHLVYQPRVRCDDLTTRSAEALLRWTHPVRGNIPPDRFISIAEESGLIVEIGLWVLEQVIRQVAAWRDGSATTLERLSVNVSPVQLMNEGFLQSVEALVADTGVRPGWIELEITEGAIIKDVDEAIAKMTRLRELGFTIAIDDFGVGYSAMTYLHVLPFDVLKIDKSFVDGFGKQQSGFAIASAIVALARALGKDVVAEGVETQEQADTLISMEVDELQGYLFSRPLRVSDFNAYLLSRKAT